MKFGQFRTIPELRMSNRLPASDDEIARKLSKVQEKLFILGETTGYHADIVRKKLKKESESIWTQHDDDQAAFQRWLDAGKPEID